MNLWRKIKYQTSCCIRGLLSFPPNIPGKRVTLLVGKKSKNCNCNGRKSPLRVKQTRNKAEQNGPIIEPLWNLKNVPSVPVFCLACYNSLYVAKRTNQVAAFERCWSTALLRGYHLSLSSVWIYVIHIDIFICWPGGAVREKQCARRGIGRVPYSGQRTHFFSWTDRPTRVKYTSVFIFSLSQQTGQRKILIQPSTYVCWCIALWLNCMYILRLFSLTWSVSMKIARKTEWKDLHEKGF